MDEVLARQFLEPGEPIRNVLAAELEVLGDASGLHVAFGHDVDQVARLLALRIHRVAELRALSDIEGEQAGSHTVISSSVSTHDVRRPHPGLVLFPKRVDVCLVLHGDSPVHVKGRLALACLEDGTIVRKGGQYVCATCINVGSVLFQVARKLAQPFRHVSTAEFHVLADAFGSVIRLRHLVDDVASLFTLRVHRVA